MIGLVAFSLLGGLVVGLAMYKESKTREGSMKGLILFISGLAVIAILYFQNLEVNLGILMAGTGHLLGGLSPEE